LASSRGFIRRKEEVEQVHQEVHQLIGLWDLSNRIIWCRCCTCSGSGASSSSLSSPLMEHPPQVGGGEGESRLIDVVEFPGKHLSSNTADDDLSVNRIPKSPSLGPSG